MGLIKQLKTFITGQQIFPVTKTKAVYDEKFGRLDKFLQNTLVESDVLESDLEEVPRDADTLGGYEPSHYAKQSDITDLFYVDSVQMTIAREVGQSLATFFEFSPREGYILVCPCGYILDSKDLFLGNIYRRNSKSIRMDIANISDYAITDHVVTVYGLFVRTNSLSS